MDECIAVNVCITHTEKERDFKELTHMIEGAWEV